MVYIHIDDIDSNVKQNISTQDNNYADTKNTYACMCARVCQNKTYTNNIELYLL